MKLKERKSIAKGFRKLREALELEDKELLRDVQETRSRAEKKREEKAARQADAAARRAETRRLAREEELEKGMLRKAKKLTAAEQLMRREKELREEHKIAEGNERKQSRVVTEKEYESVILVVNTNRRDYSDDDGDAVDTGTIEETIEVMVTMGLLRI